MVRTRHDPGFTRGPAGPVAAAGYLHAALVDERFRFDLLDDTHRVVRLQAWPWNNRTHPLIAGRDLDQLATRLTVASDDDRLFAAFAPIELDQVRAAFDGIPYEHFGWASRPLPIGIDLELRHCHELRRHPAGRNHLEREPSVTPGW